MEKMKHIHILCIGFSISLLAFQSSFVQGHFNKSMYYSWGARHFTFQGNGDDATLVLDRDSGSGMESNSCFLFGSFEMLIKLVPGNSAGTVTAYYLSSTGDNHDEIDFEFLGNISGKPYTIHTNIFTQGGGGREQQFYPWFDPTADYHNYTIHWNPSEVVWYVDSIPIRVYKNYLNEGIPYPSQKGMRVYSSIWNADSWATRGGLEKIEWENAPFVAKLRNFKARACEYNGSSVGTSQCAVAIPGNWRNSPVYSQLNEARHSRMNRVRNKYMIYDYCKDFKRFKGLFPGECFKQQY